MTRAVIFDIDGTLIDSVDLHAAAWVDALRHFGLRVDFGRMRHEIGKGGDQLLPLFVPKTMLDEQEKEISTYRADLFKREYLPKVKPFPSVPELFRRVRDSGSTVVLASSGKADEIATYAKIAGVSELVDQTVSADDVERSKPHGDIFSAALDRIAPIGPDEAVVVGDTAWDVIAADKVRLRTVALRCGGFPEDELCASGAVAVYDSPAELLKRFDETPLAPGWRST